MPRRSGDVATADVDVRPAQARNVLGAEHEIETTTEGITVDQQRPTAAANGGDRERGGEDRGTRPAASANDRHSRAAAAACLQRPPPPLRAPGPATPRRPARTRRGPHRWRPRAARPAAAVRPGRRRGRCRAVAALPGCSGARRPRRARRPAPRPISRRAWGGSNTLSISQPAAAARRSTPSRRSASDIITSPRLPALTAVPCRGAVAALPPNPARRRLVARDPLPGRQPSRPKRWARVAPSSERTSRRQPNAQPGAVASPDGERPAGAAPVQALPFGEQLGAATLAAGAPNLARSGLMSPSSSPSRLRSGSPCVGAMSFSVATREPGTGEGSCELWIDRADVDNLGSGNTARTVSVGALCEARGPGDPHSRAGGDRGRGVGRTRDGPRQGGLAGAVGGSAPGGRAEPVPGRIRTTTTVAVTELQCAP